MDDMSNSEDVHEALVLAEQIRQRDDSHYSAAWRGGPQFLGWDEDRYIAAHTDDILHSILAALAGKKIGASDLWSRPEKEEKQQHVGTIAEFNTLAFMRMITG